MGETLSKLRAFAPQLTRNRYFRVAGGYLVGALLVVEAMDVMVPALNLPESTATYVVVIAIVGFPLSLLLTWALESFPATEPPVTLLPAREDGATTPSGSLIAVLPFAVRGGGEFSYLGEGIVDLLSSKLRWAGEFRCVDPIALLSFGAREGGEGGEGGAGGVGGVGGVGGAGGVGAVGGAGRDPTGAQAIAQHFGAGLFILGDIVEAGGRLHIDATLYESRAGLPIVTRATVEGGASELFELVDDLARQLLAELTGGPSARLTRLAVMTTESFPALKAYLAGESEMRAMRRAPAVDSFRRAVEEDPSFALAWYRLAVAALWSGQLKLSRDAAEQALAHGDRLSKHDRLLLEAFHAFLMADSAEAERLYRAIAGNHPEDVEAWYQLGETLFHYNPRLSRSIAESRWTWERVLALEPEHVSALVHMAVIAACEGDHEEVDELVERALAISPEGDAVVWMLALRAWVLDDPAAQAEVAARVRASSDFVAARCAWYVALPSRTLEGAIAQAKLLTEPSRSEEVGATGHVWLAHLELAGGRWNAARDQLDAAAAIRPGSTVPYRALLSIAPFLNVPRSELEAVRHAVAEWDAKAVPRSIAAGTYFSVHDGLYSQIRSYLLGLLAGLLEDDAAALVQAEELERMSGRPEAVELADNEARSVRAQVAWNEGRSGKMLKMLGRARMNAHFELTMSSPFYSQAYERFQQAQLLETEGRIEEALCWYGSFAEQSIFDFVYLAPSHLRRAEILERLGNHEQAAHHYRRFIELWSDADPELRPRVTAAEERLSVLSA